MKHATRAAMNQLIDLLKCLRQIKELTERRPGVFYKSSRAFIHFHEDPAGIFAHIKLLSGWQRIRVQTRLEQRIFLKKVRSACQAINSPVQ
jgi:hypothetical protein